MWLYVPSVSAPASADSTSDAMPHSSILESAGALPLTWSGKPMQPRNLLRSWKRAAWIRRLSGLTCSPSTLEHGAARWIASLQASPASRTVSPASEPAPATNAGSGQPSSESFVTLVRGSWCSRTFADFFRQKEWTPFSQTWPVSGSLRNGECYRRPPLALRTGASGSSSSAWPTPASRDHKGRDLDSRNGGASLSHATETGEFSHSSPPAQATSDGPTSSPSGHTSRPRLNPAFVAWLMGTPWWWTNPAVTNSAASEMASYRCKLRSRLSSLCGDS